MAGNDLDNFLTTLILRKPPLQAAMRALALPQSSRGLDAGCGPGQLCLWLADHVGADGHVTGVDISAEYLAHGVRMAAREGWARRMAFVQASVAALPFGDDVFDWVWSSDCVGYGPGEPMALLRELERVTRPGGTLAILAWSSERLLPGHQALEARLSATPPGLAPFSSAMAPSRHFQRALGWMRALGLEKPRAEVFAGCVQAPLSDDRQRALTALLAMRWLGVERYLSESDRVQFRRYCTPESPDFVVNHPDYHAFYTYSLFAGSVPG